MPARCARRSECRFGIPEFWHRGGDMFCSARVSEEQQGDWKGHPGVCSVQWMVCCCGFLSSPRRFPPATAPKSFALSTVVHLADAHSVLSCRGDHSELYHCRGCSCRTTAHLFSAPVSARTPLKMHARSTVPYRLPALVLASAASAQPHTSCTLIVFNQRTFFATM